MITSDQMTYEEMQQAEKSHFCGVCGKRLAVCWGGFYGHNGYILKCSANVKHDTITRHDLEVEAKIAQYKKEAHMDSTALEAMSQETMLARIDQGKFPQDLKPAERVLLATAARTYGFDPIMGELTIFQGRPYVSVDGRYRKAQETDKLDGVETRPATKQEKLDWEIPDGDFFFHSDVWVKGASKAFVGWGRVRAVEARARPNVAGDAYKPTVTQPQRMAEKRAEVMALRKAFHIPLPSIEDIGGDEDRNADEAEFTSGPVTVIESTGKIVDPLASKEPVAAKAKKAEPVAPQNEESPIDMLWLQDSIKALDWKGYRAWISEKFTIPSDKATVMIAAMSSEQRREFVAEVERRLNNVEEESV